MALSHYPSHRHHDSVARPIVKPAPRGGVSLRWVLVFFAALQLGSFLKTLPPPGEATPRAGPAIAGEVRDTRAQHVSPGGPRALAGHGEHR